VQIVRTWSAAWRIALCARRWALGTFPKVGESAQSDGDKDFRS